MWFCKWIHREIKRRHYASRQIVYRGELFRCTNRTIDYWKDDLGISNDELGLLAIIRMLNRNGFLKVLEYAEMLVRLDEYQKGEELSDLNGNEVIA